VDAYIERGDPYLVARVSFFEDDEEDIEQLQDIAGNVSALFMRIARSIRTINNERANLPDVSDTEPQRLSFLVAAAMELESELKQELLELRSTAERLRRLADMLSRAVDHYEERARIHEVAKGNGHSGKRLDIE
jgi:Lon protease-like protein